MEIEKCLAERRNATITKANDLIQNSRFNLTLQQQKIVLFLISFISMEDDDFKLYEFRISDFLEICGIERSGKEYVLLKDAIKTLSDKSLWVTLEDGRETLIRWIEKPYIDRKNGIIQIKLDQDMKPFLLELKKNFTSYTLFYVLRFKSKYSLRLYEFIKSIHYHDLKTYNHKISLDDLRRIMGCTDCYHEWRDFRRKALEYAIQEINKYSDKQAEYKPLYKGRKAVAIEFFISSKNVSELFPVLKNLKF